LRGIRRERNLRGNCAASGEFIDIITHAPGQNQTTAYVSSTDPWHTAADIESSRDQTGFDLFFTSGIANKLPAMIPNFTALRTPEDSAAEIAYIEKRGYPVSYVEIGEEPDGKNTSPEDYGALYLQWATALHRVDPKLRLGGPIFEGVNEDIKVWPDAQGRTSWMGRFIDYLKRTRKNTGPGVCFVRALSLSAVRDQLTDLYREPELVKHILQVWREDGVPANVPLMITESNISWALTQPMADTFAALWLADNAGSFLASGGAAFYHSPIQPEPLRSGCHGFSTYGNFVANEKLEIQQHTSQYFASQMINLEWVKHGAGAHEMFPAEADVRDDAGHVLVTAYAVKRAGGEWSLMLINKGSVNAHAMKIEFADTSDKQPLYFTGPVTMVTFGQNSMSGIPMGRKSHADPDGPAARKTINAKSGEAVTLPRASVTVLRGKID